MVLFNDMLRTVLKSPRAERRSIKSMIEELDGLSINQMSALDKILEAWKFVHLPHYPLDGVLSIQEQERSTRSTEMIKLQERGKTKLMCNSFSYQTSKLWNKTPPEFRNAETYGTAKMLARTFVQSRIPI